MSLVYKRFQFQASRRFCIAFDKIINDKQLKGMNTVWNFNSLGIFINNLISKGQ